MTIDSLDDHVQSPQQGSSSANSGIADDHHSGSLNARHVRCELSACFARMCSAVKEYFRPTAPAIPADANHALVDRFVDEENTRDFDSEQGCRYHSTVMLVVLVATAAGIATAVYLMGSVLYAQGNTIKIISGVGATLAIGAAVYAKRQSIWKRSMKCVFQLPTEYVTFGRESEYCHSITNLTPDKVASVQLLRDGQSLPVGIDLPDWLVYDASSAKITINAIELRVQDGLTISRWTVQVKNKGGCVNGLVWEEFDIKFNLNDDSQDASGSIAMKQPKSRHEQLRQPLIGVQ